MTINLHDLTGQESGIILVETDDGRHMNMVANWGANDGLPYLFEPMLEPFSFLFLPSEDVTSKPNASTVGRSTTKSPMTVSKTGTRWTTIWSRTNPATYTRCRMAGLSSRRRNGTDEMTSRDTIYETLTSKTGKKNPATDIERWRARQLASALADMAYLNDVECEKTEDGLTFHASNGNRVGIITGNPYETKKGSDMFLVNAVEPVRDINGENWYTFARINLTDIHGVYADMDSAGAFASKVSEHLGYATPSGSYGATKKHMHDWYESVKNKLEEISDENFRHINDVFKYGMYVYRLPEDAGFVTHEQFEMVLPTTMLQNRFIIMSTLLDALDFDAASRRWDDLNYWSNVATARVVESDEDCWGCYEDELYKGNIDLEPDASDCGIED